MARLQLTAVLHAHGCAGAARGRALCFGELNHLEAFDHLAEHHVVAIEPGRGDGADKKLRAIGIAAGIGHAQDTGAGVYTCLAGKSFVVEFTAVNRLAAHAIVVRKIAALTHKLRDNAVKTAAFVVQGFARLADAFFAGAEGAEIFGREWRGVGEEFKHNAAGCLSADAEVEKHFGVFGIDGYWCLVHIGKSVICDWSTVLGAPAPC